MFYKLGVGNGLAFEVRLYMSQNTSKKQSQCSSSCSHATGQTCCCSCGGSEHGVRGRISWAKALGVPKEKRTSEQRHTADIAQKRRTDVRHRVEEQQKSYKTGPYNKPRQGDARWFFESNRSIDIVDWLIEHPTEREQIEWIANQVGDACEKILKKFPGKHKRLADHFWCDVLAALAHAIDEVSKKIDSISEDIPSYIADLVWETLKQERSSSTTSGSPNPRSKKREVAKTRLKKDEEAGLGDVFLENVTKRLVEKIVKKSLKESTLPITTKLGELQWNVRILALLMCPNPYAHRAVWEYCLLPILKAGIVIKVNKYLKNFLDTFKQPWGLPTK